MKCKTIVSSVVNGMTCTVLRSAAPKQKPSVQVNCSMAPLLTPFPVCSHQHGLQQGSHPETSCQQLPMLQQRRSRRHGPGHVLQWAGNSRDTQPPLPSGEETILLPSQGKSPSHFESVSFSSLVSEIFLRNRVGSIWDVLFIFYMCMCVLPVHIYVYRVHVCAHRVQQRAS